jgi:NitT/TauT family transport system substrate-binding protein
LKLKLCLVAGGLVLGLALSLAAEPVPDLRFGLLPAESAIPLLVAQDKGFFAAHGVTVELTMFQSPLDRNIVLQTGKGDGAIADVMTVLAFREAGLAVTATSDINEDFKLLASPHSGVTSVAQLDGKDIAVVPNFALEYIMDRIARKAGIGYKLVNIPSIPARFEALLADRLTGVVFTEPQATLLAARGAKVVGGSKASGLKAGVLLFSAKVLAEKGEAVKAFYRAYNQAVAFINATPAAEYSAALVKAGFPEAVTGYLGSGVQYQKAGPVTQAMFDDIAAWCRTKGTIKKTWALGDLATDRFLP